MVTEQELLDQIALLPQAGFIDEDRAKRWIERVLEIDPLRAPWHVARAGGFGGSEMGALVASYEGRYHPFSSARESVKHKLLLLPPSRPTVDTKRGTELESFIQGRFEDGLKREGLTFRHRDDYQEIIESAPHPDHPWLRASLDGIYEIDGQIYIVDFKAPSESVLEEYRRTLDFGDYTWQLHHYRKAAEGKGIQVDGLVLAMYDYRQNEVVPFTVAHEPERDATLIEAGTTYWNDFVLRDVIPDLPERPVAAAVVAPEEIEIAARRFVAAKMVATAAEAEAGSCRVAVERWIAAEGELAGAVVTLGDYMEVRGKPVPDTDAMVSRLVELGLPETAIERLRGPDKIDPKKAVAAFQGLAIAAREVIHAAELGGDALTKALEGLAEAVEAAPVKEKGAYDESLLQETLVSCGERADKFVTEKLSSALPRRKVIGLAEQRETVEEFYRQLVDAVSGSYGPDEDQEPEAPIAGMTS